MKVIANEGEFKITINDKVVDLPAQIREGLIFGDIFIVVLDVEYSMRNIFAFDSKGNQVWQIEDPEFIAPGDGYALVAGDDSELMALCRGVQFFIDPKTGKIYDQYWDK